MLLSDKDLVELSTSHGDAASLVLENPHRSNQRETDLQQTEQLIGFQPHLSWVFVSDLVMNLCVCKKLRFFLKTKLDSFSNWVQISHWRYSCQGWNITNLVQNQTLQVWDDCATCWASASRHPDVDCLLLVVVFLAVHSRLWTEVFIWIPVHSYLVLFHICLVVLLISHRNDPSHWKKLRWWRVNEWLQSSCFDRNRNRWLVLCVSQVLTELQLQNCWRTMVLDWFPTKCCLWSGIFWRRSLALWVLFCLQVCGCIGVFVSSAISLLGEPMPFCGQ